MCCELFNVPFQWLESMSNGNDMKSEERLEVQRTPCEESLFRIPAGSGQRQDIMMGEGEI